MNRSQRRLQQLKQTVLMKFSVLEKQKEDIKEIIDDYTSQIVTDVNHLLNKEQELIHDPGLCHIIIQKLDKASQILSDLAIKLDSVLDADDIPLDTANGNGIVFKKDTAPFENLDHEFIRNLSNHNSYKKGNSLVQVKDAMQDQLCVEAQIEVHQQQQSHQKEEHYQQHQRQQGHDEKQNQQDEKQRQEQNEKQKQEQDEMKRQEKYERQEQEEKQKQEQDEKQKQNEKHNEKQRQEQDEKQEQEEKQKQEQDEKQKQNEKHNEKQRQEQDEKQEQEEKQKQEQEEKQKQEQEEKQKQEQEEKQKQEQEEKQKQEQEEKQKQEQEEKQKQEQEEKQKQEQEEKQKQEQNEKQTEKQNEKQEQDEKHNEKLRQEQDKKQKQEQEEKQKQEQDEKQKQEQNEKQRQEQNEKQRQEQNEKQRQEQDEKQKQEHDEKHNEKQKQEQEEKQKQEQDEKQKQEQDEKQKHEQDEKQKQEQSEKQEQDEKQKQEQEDKQKQEKSEKQNEKQEQDEKQNEKQRQELDEKQKQEQDEKQEQEEKQKQEQEEKQKQEQEEKQKQEQEEKQKQEQEEKQKQEQEEKQKQEQEEKQKQEQEEKQKQEQNEKQTEKQNEKQEQDEKHNEKLRQEQDKKQKQEQEEKQKQEQDEKQKQEQNEKQRQEQNEKQRQEQNEKQRQEQDEKQKQEQDEKHNEKQKQEQEEKQKQEQDEKQKQEQDEKQKHEQDEKQKQEQSEKQEQDEKQKQEQEDKQKQEKSEKQNEKQEQDEKQNEKQRQELDEKQKQEQDEIERQEQDEKQKQEQDEIERQEQDEKQKQEQDEIERQEQDEIQRQEKYEKQKQEHDEKQKEKQVAKQKQAAKQKQENFKQKKLRMEDKNVCPDSKRGPVIEDIQAYEAPDRVNLNVVLPSHDPQTASSSSSSIGLPTSSWASARSSASSSEPVVHQTTHCIDSNVLPSAMNHLLESSNSLPGNTWTQYRSTSGPHIDIQPPSLLISSLHNQHSTYEAVSSYGDTFHYHNVPHMSNQPSPVPVVRDQYGRIIPLTAITSAEQFGILPLCSFLPGHCVNRHSSCGPIFTQRPRLHKPNTTYYWRGPHQNTNSVLRINESLYPHEQISHQNNHQSMLNPILQDQQLNCSLATYNPVFAPTLTGLVELGPGVSDSSVSFPQSSRSLAAISNLSVIPSALQQDPPNHITSISESGLGDSKVSTEYRPSHLQHATETIPILDVLKSCTSASALQNNLQESFTEKCQESVRSSRHGSCSQSLEAALPSLPVSKQSHPLKRNTKRLMSHTRSLQELIKEVEKNTYEKSTKCSIDRKTETLSQERVSRTSPQPTQFEASESQLMTREGSPQTVTNKLQPSCPSVEGSVQHDMKLKVQVMEFPSLNILPLQPEKDSVFTAVVSSLTHPWSFYIQMVSSVEVVSGSIRRALETGAEKAGTLQVGMNCLAKLTEHNYYRAKILSVPEKDGEITDVKVLLIDCGSRKLVSPTDIYSFPDSLTHHPCQAMFCALHGASPKNSGCMWTEGAILEFQQQTKDVQVQVRIIQPSASDNMTQSLLPHIVDMRVAMPQVSKTPQKVRSTHKSMAAHLIEKGFAKLIVVEDQQAVLGKMYSSVNCNARDTIKSCDDLKPINKSQSFDKTPAKKTLLKPKVFRPSSCLHKTKDQNIQVSALSRPLAANTLASITSCTISTPDITDVSDAGTKRQKVVNHELKFVVDQKLHSLGQAIRSSQGELKGKYSKHLFHQTLDSSKPLLNKEDSDLEILVMISAVISPSSFFVHRVDEDTVHKFKQLEHKLLSLTTSALTKLSTSFSPTLHSMVCAMWSEDGLLYRGLVLDIDRTENEHLNSAPGESSCEQLLLFFIDYGDFEWVPRSKVFLLPNEFKSLTPLVLWCSLRGVKPHGAVIDRENEATGPLLWSVDVVNKFKSMICGGKVFSAVISETSLQQMNIITAFQYEPVSMFLLDRKAEGEDVCVNHELIRMELAALRPTGLELDKHTIDNGNIREWDPMNEEHTSLRNSYKVDTGDAGVALVGYSDGNIDKAGQKVCVYFNRPRGCLRGDRCTNLHTKVDICDVPYGKVPVRVFVEDQSDLLPEPGATVTVTVSAVISPGLFYVTLPWSHLSLKDASSDTQALRECLQEETLDSMMDNMQKFYSSSSGYDGDLMLLAPGQAMAAKVSGQWARAKVIDTEVECGLVQVMSVDFGCVTWVDERNLRELGLQFLHLTPQAVECSLVDIEPHDRSKNWEEEVCEQFAEMVNKKTFVALVKYRYPSGRISVVLSDTSGARPSLNQRLVDCGLAQYSTNEKTADKTCGQDKTTEDGSLILSFLPV